MLVMFYIAPDELNTFLCLTEMFQFCSIHFKGASARELPGALCPMGQSLCLLLTQQGPWITKGTHRLWMTSMVTQ